MKSRGNYFYFKKLELNTNFTQVPNQLLNINLTATEKLILIYLLSNAESFRVTNYRIEKAIGSDHRTVKKAIKKFLDMKLIIQVSNRTLGLNMVELIKLAKAADINEEIDGNSTIGSSTNSQITDSNATISKCTTNMPVQLPVTNGNSTVKSTVDYPSNNSKQQEFKEERKKDVSSVSGIDIQNEINEYLKSPSKFFWGDNVHLLVQAYEQYRVHYPNSKLNSIKQFDTVLYFFLLRLTNKDNVTELNEALITPITFNLSDLHVAFKLIISKRDVNSEYKEEVLKVINAKTGKENCKEESDKDSEVA